MNAAIENYAARGLSPRAASPSTSSWTMPNGLPSDSCANRCELTPNIETLKTILRWHGCFGPFVEAVAEGYAPREFRIGMTGWWRVRDTFYMLAKDAISRLNGRIPVNMIGLNDIMTRIAESDNPYEMIFPEAENIKWVCKDSKAGYFQWPSSSPSYRTLNFTTSCKLFILNSIWALHPALLAVDFSAGLAFFLKGTCPYIQKRISDAIQSRSTLPESEAKSAETTVEAGESALTAEVHRLLDVLQDGPKSRQELQEVLEVGRTALLKRFLDPARESGLVMTTEQGSSPNQRYRLVSEDETEGGKQEQTGSETGLAYPVSSSLVLPQKQANLPKSGVFSPVAVPIFAGGHAPVRLARYIRWLEAERALILFGRVERFLRSSFESGTWKELGIVDKLNESDLFRFENCLFDPKYWGSNAGVVLRQEVVDSKDKRQVLAVGESSLLHLFAQKTGFDLAVCSETERSEMGRLKVIIPLAEFYLMNFYAQRFGISSDLDKPYHGDKKAMQPAALEPFNLYNYGMTKIVFHGKDRAPQVQLGRLDVAGRTVLQPITFYASAKAPKLSFMSPEVPDRPVLYNADAIAAHPGATVILTDELGIPLINDSDSDYIFSTWYGGMDVIDMLDRDLLEGHPLNWLCFDNGDGPVKMYEKAMRVKVSFQKHGLEIAFFHVFDNVTWARNPFGMDTGIYESSRVLSFDELKAEAAQYGVDAGESHACADDDLRVYSMDELLKLKPREFFLYPLLKEGDYCVAYGCSGVAKTWFALHLAITITQGTAPFEGWDFRGTPLNVLYVAGEMPPSEYGNRIDKLLAEQKTNPRFRLIREKLDLTTPEHQARVRKAVKKQKSKVVVLDNLSTLADNGHMEDKFKKIYNFIEQLQADGITVILVHHENKEGDIKGSGRIKLVADISLHLFHAGDGTKIELLVQPDKARSVSNAESPSFHTEFDPKNPTAVWPTRPLTLEERRRLDIDDPLGEVELNIGKKRKNNQLAWEYLDEDGRGKAIIEGMLNGCHDDVIAADLAVRESVIADFKQQYGLSPEALNLHLAEAKEITKNNTGKITPNELAPILWKLLTDNKE